ncbi:MAG: redox-sensing transcriptional repressor Rex [Ruminococcaceae bacterium]|nr:redox-sensing transcriptional repressor Rex [Oscillospiraceae bacterium]
MSEQKKEREESLEQLSREIDGRDCFRPQVSSAVIRRLPRYFRYLRELIRMGKTRVSSAELSRMMNLTASQIRQDLNCFGGFGQQGYGYNVNYLYTKICELLGVGFGFRAAVIGAGNLGTALVSSPMFENRGMDVVAMFDVSPAVIGKTIGNAPVYSMDELEEKLKALAVEIVILTLPKEHAPETARRLAETDIHGIWNFTGKELNVGNSGIVVENVHIGDSLMTLCYEVAQRMSSEKKDAKKDGTK